MIRVILGIVLALGAVVGAYGDTSTYYWQGKGQWSAARLLAAAQLYASAGLGLGAAPVQPPMAALANGALGHAFELDSAVKPSAGTHPAPRSFLRCSPWPRNADWAVAT